MYRFKKIKVEMRENSSMANTLGALKCREISSTRR